MKDYSLNKLKEVFKKEVLKHAEELHDKWNFDRKYLRDFLNRIDFDAYGKPDHSEITLMASVTLTIAGASFVWFADAEKVE